MSLPETLDWCEEHEMPRCRHAAWVGEHCVGQHPLDGPDVGTCRMVELRIAGRDDLVIRREDIIEFTLTDNGIGVEDKDQVVVGCCHDEGPYWNLEAGRYLLIPLAAAEGGET